MTKRIPLLILAAVPLVLAGCGSGEDEGGKVVSQSPAGVNRLEGAAAGGGAPGGLARAAADRPGGSAPPGP